MMTTTISRGNCFLASACCLLIFAGSATAGTIEIQFTGLDITYDGDTIETSIGGDELSSATITVDGIPAGPVLTPPDLDIDLVIPGVDDIPIGGGVVVSDPGGILDLSFPTDGGTDFLDLDLGAATVTYVDLGVVQFTFAASLATISGQDLPFGVVPMANPVNISFSAQVAAGSVTDDGTYITGFSASGTGEVEGPMIPEPTTVALLALATLGMIGVYRRK